LPTPQFNIHNSIPGQTYFVLEGNEVGHRSAVDLACAYTLRDVRIRGVGMDISVPTKKSVYHLLLHKDIEQRAEPLLRLYDTTLRGVAKFNDPARARDLLDIRAQVDYLGLGAAKVRSNDVPRYSEMIQHVCDKMHWDASVFHCYRCEVDYPIYGSQFMIEFDPSASPEL